MGIHRFFLSSNSIDTQHAIVSIYEQRLIHQMRKVLRLKPGAVVNALDGEGHIYRCRVKTITPDKITAEIEDTQVASGDLSLEVTLAVPVLKGSRFDWAVEKLTELGACRLVPTICQRSAAHRGVLPYPDKSRPSNANRQTDQSPYSLNRLRRWQEIAREAAEQCERATILQVVKPVSLSQLFAEGLGQASLCLVCAERAQAMPLHDLICRMASEGKRPDSVLVVVGPEGGFTPEEMNFLMSHHCQMVVLGSRILRSETAAVYAMAQIAAIWDA